MKYKHLSQAERYQIYALMKAGHDQTQIALLLNRYKSTISRELNRNTGSRGYRPKQASELYVERNNLKTFYVRVKTLTYDNGKSLQRTAGLIDQQLNSTAYFARPFGSWERCSNEILNGFLRQYIPKKRAMSTAASDEEF